MDMLFLRIQVLGRRGEVCDCYCCFVFLCAGVCSTLSMAHMTQSTASWTTQTLQQSALWEVTRRGATSTSVQQPMANVCR